MAIDPMNLAGTAKLTFADEFNSLSLWNGTSGTWATNAWYNDEWNLKTSNGFTRQNNGEEQWYISDNFAGTGAVNPWTVSGGVLTLTAAPASSTIQSQINGYKYTSGEINSYRSFAQTYGYFEMRAQLPAGQGLWPAFWLLPKDGSWPPELDIMEVLGHNTTGLVTTVHTSVGGHNMTSTMTTVADMSKGFHTYGVDWQKDFITWYFDGKAIFKTATPADMNKPMYILANLAVGGYWPGSPNASTQFPAEFKIDYIRAYSDAGTTPTPPTPTDPIPTDPIPTDPVPPTVTPATLFTLPESAAPTSTISGTTANNTLTGNTSANLMDGKAGSDAMSGGQGDDTYMVQQSGDRVIERSGEGVDTVRSFISSYTLPDNVENLTLSGTGTQTATGNNLNNILIGNKDPDGYSILKGGGGKDILIAGADKTTMTGGGGKDIFRVDSRPTDSVRITDFTVGEDKIDMRALFKKAGYTGSDPVKDGFLTFKAVTGDTVITFDMDGKGAQHTAQTLFVVDDVAPTALKAQVDWIFV